MVAGDNFHVDVTSYGEKHLRLALELAFVNSANGFVKFYAVDSKYGLILFWEDPTEDAMWNGHRPLVPWNLDDAVHAVLRWLQDGAEYDKPHDIDGSLKRGWRVYNKQYEHLAGCSRAFVAIAPEYIEFHK